MDDFYAELKERARRHGLQEFVDWVQYPVLVLDFPDESADDTAGFMTPLSVESTVLLQEGESSDEETGAEGSTRIMRRLIASSRNTATPITIGRSENCDIVVDHYSISKVHAVITRTATGAYEIRDADSRNGVTINGRRVPSDSPMKAQPDDMIRIGAVMGRILYPKQLYALLLNKPAPQTSIWRRLRDRTYLAFWSAEALSYVADSLYRVALVSWVMSQTESGGQALAAVGAFTIIPLIVVLLISGAIVDRVPRARVMMFALAARGLVAATFAISTAGAFEFWHVYLIAALMGASDAFVLPAATALPPELVRKEELPSANALTTLSVHSANIIGPLIGAGLATFSGYVASFSCVAIFFLLSSLCVARIPSLARPTRQAPRSPPSSMRDVVQRLKDDPWLWMTSLLYGLVTSIGFATSMVAMPVLVKSSLRVDMSYYNVIQAMVSIGALAASIWLPNRIQVRRKGVLAYVTCAVFGASILVAALPITIFGVAVAQLVRGAAQTVILLIWISSLQQLVPRDMLGRAASIDAFVQFTCVISAFVAFGWLTTVAEIELVFVLGGSFLLVVPLLMLLHPRIRRFT